jgi:hypothetical protein
MVLQTPHFWFIVTDFCNCDHQIHAAKPLTPKAVEASKWEVDIAGKRYPAVASLKPMCVLLLLFECALFSHL